MDYSYPLFCSCLRNRDRVALIGRDEEAVTYRVLERRIAGLTAGLGSLGLGGAVVATISENEVETVELYMALARTTAIAVPVNTRLSIAEKRHILEDSGATALVVGDGFAAEGRALVGEVERLQTLICVGEEGDSTPSLRRLRDTPPGPEPRSGDGDEQAPATVMYTSGTTGFPKGVVRSHRANAWNAVNSALGAPRSAADVELFNLPAFGIGFLHFLMPALLGGATVVIDGAFDPSRAWELLERHRVTTTFLAPTMIDSMLSVPGQDRRDLGALETIYTAYVFPDRLREAALARFGPVFVHMYGLTEAQLTCATREEFGRDPSSVGRAMGVSRVAVLDSEGREVGDGGVGEIAFEGPSVMSGYHRQPEATDLALRQGWLRSGDLGRVDEEGNLHYVGRDKEMIKTGGFSVDPVEVENAILAREDVVEVAVVGAEDEHWGEAVVAFVVMRGGVELDVEDLAAGCKARIASYKVPKRVIALERLPKNPTGKVERGALRKLLGA